MRKLIILVLVVAAIIATTTWAAGWAAGIGHGGLMRADIGKWMHDQVQVLVLAPITEATLQVFPSWQGAEETAPATSVWHVASAVRSAISYLMKVIQLIALIGIWRRRRVAGGQGLTLIAQLRSAFRFLNRSSWYRVATIVS